MLEAQILLGHILECESTFLYAYPNKEIEKSQIAAYEALIARRQQDEPMAYLVGSKVFGSLLFETSEDALIPRLETTLLVQAVLTHLPKGQQELLDLGTGCGTIASSLAHARPECYFTATDISAKALAVAKKNAIRLQLNNIDFVESDWFQALGEKRFDGIVSNPPYIRENDLDFIHLNSFEPRVALSVGPTGFEAFERIVKNATQFLKPQGFIAFQHGFDQAEILQILLAQAGFNAIKTIHDVTGNARVTMAYPQDA